MTRNIPLKVFFNSVLIVILLFIAFPVKQTFALPTEIFFSEYIEGSGFNKALEIYNGTGAAVDLSTYSIELYSNGAASPSKTVALIGIVADGDVFVIAHTSADPAIIAQADQIDPSSNVINFNGDDALVLKNGTVVVDVIGQVGVDPGSYWGTGGVTTQNHTLRRKTTICSGDTDMSNAFDPALEWDGYANNTFDGFGTHTTSCIETAPSVTSTTPSAGAVDITVDANLEITFSESVNVVDTWFGIVCSLSGPHTASVSGGPTTFALNPDLDFDNSETCTVTILAAQVADQDTEDPPDLMVADYVFDFDIEDLVVLEPPEIIITEIMYDPDSPEDDWEWVEIYNADDTAVDLAGFVIDDGNNSSHSYANIASGTLAPGEQAVLYNSDDLSETAFQAAWGIVNLIPVSHWSAMGLNNSNNMDMVSLWENYASYAGDHATHANAIDTVDYGGPGFPDPWDKSIYLTDLTADNNQGANWAVSSEGGVTPLYTGYTSAPAFGNEGEIGSPGIRPTEMCGDPYTPIYNIQGDGFASPLAPYTVVVTEGVVVSDFQYGGLRGYNIQDKAGDGDSATSDGIFIYDYNTYVDVNVGDYVRVRGKVKEQYGLTELTYLNQVWLCGLDSVDPTPISLPVAEIGDLEVYEGMLVSFPQSLYITEYYNFDRYGEIVVATDRQFQPTALFEPGSPEAAQLLADNLLSRIKVDDGRTWSNPDPAFHPNGGVFDLTNLFRGGDILNNLTGVVDYAYGEYKIQPTTGADYVNANPRTPAPDDVGGGIKVASFNVLNYFTTIDTGSPICGPGQDQGCRGADTVLEFERQRAKIIAALTAMAADVVGLIEIENNEYEAVADLVGGLNDAAGAGTYAYVDTGYIGEDVIKAAFIYKPASVSLVGGFAVLDSDDFVDPNDLGEPKNRPALAQTFMDNQTGGIFTAVVNHLKSKGSECGPGDDDPDAGSCNLTRTLAAEKLVDWLVTDPTGSGDADFLIIGDLNAYDKEDPIDALIAGEYSDLVFQFVGEEAYSYVFDGQLGYLDHGLAFTNGGMEGEITGATVWHINADEPDLIDYDMSYKKDAQDAIYAPDPYRSSDHDPVIIGLDVCDEIAPTLEIELSHDTLWPANHKYVEVIATVTAADNFDPDPVVTLLSVTSSEEDDDGGDGHTSDDIVILDDYTFQLRAERSGNSKEGRVYTITYQVEDDCGNLTVESATVVVPKSQKNK